VNDLLVRNPLDVAVLLYEGEEMRGAQQDRTLDVSVLVPAGATLEVPVSCVEAGRWDGTRAADAFAAAPQAAFPSLRRAKSAAAAAAGRAAQEEVWELVGEKALRHGAVSETGALRDVFAAREDVVAEFAGRIPREDGQLGAVAAIAGEVVVVDVVGRADVWAALHGPLVAGYALDAVEHLGGPQPAPPAVAVAERVLRAALERPGIARPGVGLGQEVRVAGRAAQGAPGSCTTASSSRSRRSHARRARPGSVGPPGGVPRRGDRRGGPATSAGTPPDRGRPGRSRRA
jgi:hypothetical protein